MSETEAMICDRCRQTIRDPDDWVPLGDGTRVICSGCVTGQEQQSMDRDDTDTESAVREMNLDGMTGRRSTLMLGQERALALDLIERTEIATRKVAERDAGVDSELKVADIVAAVEADLPADYPAPTQGKATRQDLIAAMAADILSGEMYE